MSQSNAKKIISLGVTLFIITAVTGTILGVVRDITLEPIRATQEKLREEALRGALPEAEEFSTLELAEGAESIIKDVQEGFSAGNTAGYCVTVLPRGYAGPIELVAGITNDGNLRAIRIMNQSETPGLGAKAVLPIFYEQFKDAAQITVVKVAPAAPGEIQAISGATITSDAVATGVNAALSYWKNHLAPGTRGGTEAVSGVNLPAKED